MTIKQVSFEPEFYPIERVLIVGPLADALPFADLAARAGHTVTLLLPDEEAETAKTPHAMISPDEAVPSDAFDLVLELHSAHLELKAESLLYLEDALDENVPILTLTLAISAGELTKEMLIADRVIGVSILPPFSESRIAELMATPHTSRETIRTAERFFESVGLSTVQVGDAPGGVLARTVCCLVNEAALALQEKIATAGEIDRAMQLGVNYPRGPLAWGDRIGLDRVLAVMDGLYAEYKEERYRPAPLLKRLVRAGFNGARAGIGFSATLE
jgi:3-hydroxybutyryl-CoA dehydrogenase